MLSHLIVKRTNCITLMYEWVGNYFFFQMFFSSLFKVTNDTRKTFGTRLREKNWFFDACGKYFEKENSVPLISTLMKVDSHTSCTIYKKIYCYWRHNIQYIPFHSWALKTCRPKPEQIVKYRSTPSTPSTPSCMNWLNW